eukprot:TRINITY_DN5764_c0_g1_i1.p1 TRINITY_DN5764_c0_g1~~TRINITY_DN5764_c0_g1_i1.p1  ORF type:complete len:150 (+),score=22.71 TRINITY_DN5764_c0_g1_i1:722-1171(+)
MTYIVYSCHMYHRVFFVTGRRSLLGPSTHEVSLSLSLSLCLSLSLSLSVSLSLSLSLSLCLSHTTFSEYGLPEWQVRRLAPAPRTLRRESSVRARQREAERQARFELNGRGLTRDLAERTRRALDAPATVRTKRSHGLGWIKTSTAGAQ